MGALGVHLQAMYKTGVNLDDLARADERNFSNLRRFRSRTRVRGVALGTRVKAVVFLLQQARNIPISFINRAWEGLKDGRASGIGDDLLNRLYDELWPIRFDVVSASFRNDSLASTGKRA